MVLKEYAGGRLVVTLRRSEVKIVYATEWQRLRFCQWPIAPAYERYYDVHGVVIGEDVESIDVQLQGPATLDTDDTYIALTRKGPS